MTESKIHSTRDPGDEFMAEVNWINSQAQMDLQI